MDKETLVELINGKLLDIRREKGLSQEAMSDLIGISKKTYIQAEKGRQSLGWTTTVCLCALLFDSEVIQEILGGDAMDVILDLCFGKVNFQPKRYHVSPYWQDVKNKNGYKVQKNTVTGYYRLLDKYNNRVFTSTELKYLEEELERYHKQMERAEHGWLL